MGSGEIARVSLVPMARCVAVDEKGPLRHDRWRTARDCMPRIAVLLWLRVHIEDDDACEVIDHLEGT